MFSVRSVAIMTRHRVGHVDILIQLLRDHHILLAHVVLHHCRYTGVIRIAFLREGPCVIFVVE